MLDASLKRRAGVRSLLPVLKNFRRVSAPKIGITTLTILTGAPVDIRCRRCYLRSENLVRASGKSVQEYDSLGDAYLDYLSTTVRYLHGCGLLRATEQDLDTAQRIVMLEMLHNKRHVQSDCASCFPHTVATRPFAFKKSANFATSTTKRLEPTLCTPPTRSQTPYLVYPGLCHWVVPIHICTQINIKDS